MKISIVVVTYNSALTVVDTLESIKSQEYCTSDIELIISDDASTDNTVDIVEKWLAENKAFFFNVIFIRNDINKGVSANCNIAWKASSGMWIKSIGGDDILNKNCIRDNLSYIENNSDCAVLFSKMEYFGSMVKITPDIYDVRFFDKDSYEQYKYFKFFSFNIAPTSFINRQALEKVGYADERYRNIEDLPLWLKFTKAGYKLSYLDSVTVKYRVSQSISKSDHRYINVDFIQDLILINKDGALPFIKAPYSELLRYEQLGLLKFQLLISFLTNNKKGFLSRSLNFCTWILRPIHLSRTLFKKTYLMLYQIGAL